MTTPMLLTGGTGTLGRLLVPRLQSAGQDVRVLSRHDHAMGGVEFATGDLATGAGLDAAVEGCNVVIHAAGSANGDDVKARHLTDAAARAGVRHIVSISVVGADRIPIASAVDRAMFGYFAAKREAERIISGSGVPWTTLRATQFHQLLASTVQAMARLPVVPVPAGFQFQPIDAAEVADELARLALGAPAGLVQDVGGPEVHSMTDLVRSYLRARHRRSRPIIRMPLPGKAAAAFRSGANLAPDRAVGQRTWAAFVDPAGSNTDDVVGAIGQP